MRKIRPNERRNGMKYCTFCKPKRVDALYRNQYLTTDQKLCFACEEHKHMLVDGPLTPEHTAEQVRKDKYYKDSMRCSDISEGEYQAYRMFGI